MHALLAKAAAFVHTKAALALLGATLVAGGGTAVAVAATHGNLGAGLAPTGQHGSATKTDHASAEGTLTAYTAPSGATPGSITVKLAGGTTVTFAVNSDTRVNGGHANTLADLPGIIGGKVQVQAEQQSGAGNPLATKITVEDSDSSVELRGTVASVTTTGGSFVLTTDTGSVTITVTADTQFAPGGSGLADLQTGDQANVQGIKQPDGSVVAAHVEVAGGHGAQATHTSHPDGTPEATEGPED